MSEKTRARALMMEEMTVEDTIHALEKTGSVIVPIGGTEQHGYHMPLSTDSLQAKFIARGVSELTGCVVAPCIGYSHSYGTLPGTTNIQPSTLTRLLVDIGTSLYEQGFRTIIIYPCHLEASTLFAAEDAGKKLQAGFPDAHVAVYANPGAPEQMISMLRAVPDGHAGAGETSTMLHVAPDLVRDERPFDLNERWWLEVVGKLHQLDESGLDSAGRMKFVPAAAVDAAVREAEPEHGPVKFGVFGDPNKARADAGRTYCDWKIAQFARFVRELESGAPAP